jgi:hypothetical protein
VCDTSFDFAFSQLHGRLISGLAVGERARASVLYSNQKGGSQHEKERKRKGGTTHAYGIIVRKV